MLLRPCLPNGRINICITKTEPNQYPIPESLLRLLRFVVIVLVLILVLIEFVASIVRAIAATAGYCVPVPEVVSVGALALACLLAITAGTFKIAVVALVAVALLKVVRPWGVVLYPVATCFVGKQAATNFLKLVLYHVVMHWFFMPVAIGELHVVANGLCKALFLFGVGFHHSPVKKRGNVVAQVPVFQPFLRVRQNFRLFKYRFSGWRWVWRINLQVKTRHLVQVVPQFMLVVFNSFQMGVQCTHQFYDNLCVFKPFFLVLNCCKVFNHLLHITAILWHEQLGAGGIVFHHQNIVVCYLQEVRICNCLVQKNHKVYGCMYVWRDMPVQI